MSCNPFSFSCVYHDDMESTKNQLHTSQVFIGTLQAPPTTWINYKHVAL